MGTETETETFAELLEPLSERRCWMIRTMLRASALLIDDGTDDPMDACPEYARGQIELILVTAGWSGEHYDLIRQEILRTIPQTKET